MRLPGTYISPAETGFYYLQSRYYDPETGRFISSDGYLSTGQDILGSNMFAYCLNNPVNNHDPSGKFALTATFCGIALWKIGVAFVGLVGTFILADTIAKNSPAIPSISLPKINVKPKTDSKEKDLAPSTPKIRLKALLFTGITHQKRKIQRRAQVKIMMDYHFRPPHQDQASLQL